MTTIGPRRLGKRPPRIDPRVPHLKKLVSTALPALPDQQDWYSKVKSWPMLANDQLGDCVEAGALHCVQQRDTYGGHLVIPTNAEAEALYTAWSGWNPADSEATDQGTDMNTALADWLHKGIAMPGGKSDKLDAYAAISHVSLDWIRYSIWKFGGALIGIECPEAWLEATSLLDLPNGLGEIAGGHCVYLCGWETTKTGVLFDVITWGMHMKMTERAANLVIDEAYSILDKDWLNNLALDPAGLDWAVAEAAMQPLRPIAA